MDSAKHRTTRGRGSHQKVKRSSGADDETTLVHDHHDDTTDASLFTPGAFSVSANDSVEFATSNDVENNRKEFDESEILDTNASLVVAAEVVTEDNNDKGKALDEEDLELKIAQAVESRLMQRDQALVVAEVLPPPTNLSKGEGPMVYNASCGQCCSDCCMKWKYPIILLLLVFCGAAVAIALVGESSVEPSSSETGTSSPVEFESRQKEIKQIVQRDGNTKPFEDPNSPQSLALEWMFTDSITMAFDNVAPLPIVSQRYALAVLYYSTNGTRWTNQLGFLTDRPACEWNDGSQVPFPSSSSALPSLPDTYGVHCDNFANVKQVQLSQNGLDGTLPSELIHLLDLQVLTVDQNSLKGSIPPELGRLTDMRMVFLDSNSMTGTIPTEIGLWIPLESFYANDNRFQGTLPTELGRLAYLQDVYVYNNYLTGTIPSELSSNTNVEVIFDPQQGA